MNTKFNYALIVPTLNPGANWRAWLDAFAIQSYRPIRALLVDSGSDDGQIEKSGVYGFEVQIIAKSDFNHGGTRQQCVDQVKDECEIVVFLTQDAILDGPQALANLIAVFEDDDIAAAFGRQLPHNGAGALARHARLFNYSAVSDVRSKESISKLGIKTCFMSNSFAAYRIKDLMSIGGFNCDIILGEDTCAAAKLILAGRKTAYVANACVYHSHDYSMGEEFRRYFDIGVLHSQQSCLLSNFRSATGEGVRYVKSELKYLLKHAFWLIPFSLARTTVKLLGYRLGRQYSCLPERWLPLLSMHKRYWLVGKFKNES